MNAILRKAVICLLILLYHATTGAQTQIGGILLDRNMQITEIRSEAAYVREVTPQNDGTYAVKISFFDGRPKMKGTYLDESLLYETGTFEYFFANGVMESTGQFSKGVKIGTWKRWDIEGNVRPDRFYPEEVNTALIPESSPAEFPGGDESLTVYLEEHLVYPEEARKTLSEGTVYTAFQINEYGVITQVEVIQGANYFLDNEARRLIYEMPTWKPAKKNGQFCESKFILPILFDLDKNASVHTQVEAAAEPKN